MNFVLWIERWICIWQLVPFHTFPYFQIITDKLSKVCWLHQVRERLDATWYLQTKLLNLQQTSVNWKVLTINLRQACWQLAADLLSSIRWEEAMQTRALAVINHIPTLIHVGPYSQPCMARNDGHHWYPNSLRIYIPCWIWLHPRVLNCITRCCKSQIVWVRLVICNLPYCRWK